MAESDVAARGGEAGLELRAHGLLQVEQASPSLNSLFSAGSEQQRRRTSFFNPGSPAVTQHSHRVPGSQYAALAAWTVLLMLQYGFVRLTCSFGIPPDCRERGDPVQDLSDIHYLLFTGGLLAIFAGVHWPDRFQYLFDFKRQSKLRGVVFVVAMGASGVVWGALGMVPSLQQFSLTGFHPEFFIPMTVLIGGAAFLVSWHFWVAWKHNSIKGFLAYSLSRVALVILYGSYIVVKLHNEEVSFHFHHYAVAFLAAALAEFNHPLSMLVLAIGTGVFVQGIAVYGADAILSHPQWHFTFRDRQGVLWESPPVSHAAANFFSEHCYLHMES